MFYPTLPLSLSSIRVVKITQLHSEEWFILMRNKYNPQNEALRFSRTKRSLL